MCYNTSCKINQGGDGIARTKKICPVTQCGDSDWLCGEYDTFKQFLEEKANEIDCDDGWGGYRLESVIEDIGWAFDNKLAYEQAKEIVLANRTNYDDE